MRILAFLFAARVFAAAPVLEIKVDQVGYLTNSPKLAFVSFPIKTASSISSGFSVQKGDIVSHSPGERVPACPGFAWKSVSQNELCGCAAPNSLG